MFECSVKELAERLQISTSVLLEQIEQENLPHRDEDSMLNPKEISLLGERIRKYIESSSDAKQHARTQPSKITLRRTKTETLQPGRGGHKVTVQRRKRRTYVKTEPAKPAPQEDKIETASELRKAAEKTREQEQKRKTAQLAEEQRKRELEEKRHVRETERLEAEKKQAELEAAKRQAQEDARAANEIAVKQASDVKHEARSAAKSAMDNRATKPKEAEKGKAPKRADRDRRDRETIEERSFKERTRKTPKKQVTMRERRRRVRPTVDIEQGGEFEKPVAFVAREVEVGESIVLHDLAQQMSVKVGDLIKQLMQMGVMATINQILDQDTAVLIIEEMGHKVKIVSEDKFEDQLQESLNVEGESTVRPPVVTVMGHVDHGKTSLLDYIRNTRVASGEVGGITQHIGAYNLTIDQGEITFLDTPGHAAFSAMRARGANSTDIVVLVCAANDGVMPQTLEAVQHAQAAKVPIIVAVNKMDLDGADPDRVRNELSAHNVVPEEWGGENLFVNVSAQTGEGIDSLLEAITLQATILELQAVPEAPGRGVVIESKIERGRGPVATLLIQNGTLKHGDVVIAGEYFGKARALVDDQGKNVVSAGPAIPVEMLGLNGTPAAGDEFSVAPDDRQARQIADSRAQKQQRKQHAVQQAARLENMFSGMGKGEKRVLKMILKADVRGSLEAVVQACGDIGNDEVSVQILGSGIGGINESDVNMAFTYEAVIFGFNVRMDKLAKFLVDQNNLDVRYYNVIYELLDDIRAILETMLVPEEREEIVGTAEVRDVFNSPRYGQIAGCMVVEGTVLRNKKIRVLRNETVIYQGELESLRRFKDDVQEVRNGFECGIGVRNYNDVREGDLIEVYESREVARAL